jgi:peroxiredoxin
VGLERRCRLPHRNKLLHIGDDAPKFALPDAVTGKLFTLGGMLGQPAVIVFLRGTWCPNARAYMSHLSANMEEFTDRGARVAAVIAQKMERVQEYLTKETFPYPLLVDEDRQVVKDYGVHVKVSWEAYNIARPATFILDREGVIRYEYVGSTQFDFPEDRDVLDVLDRLNEQQAAYV